MFTHLDAMTDDRGLFEHAEGTRPRPAHGYCTDDNARLLVVTCREPDDGVPARLSRIALAVTLAAQTPFGRTRNRLDVTGRWTDRPTTHDCWGRSLWALGVAATAHDDPAVRRAALAGFDAAVIGRSRWPRAMAFAALGAAAVTAADPGHPWARSLLVDAVAVIGAPSSGRWPWPERRLTYANAVLADATMAAGAALGDTGLVDRGLDLLAWLLELETRDGHLSPTGTAGRDVDTVGPQFDQQPIEAATLADACWRASTLTGDQHWSRGVALAVAWFDGANDVGVAMHDPVSGGGFDGLTPVGVNTNQGAESTLALVSTRQRARALAGTTS